MTTSSEQAQTPAEPGGSSSELSEIWRAIGRLEGTTNALLEGQQELKLGQHELNGRIDRMFYAMLGVGGALLVAVFASRFIGS